MRHIFVSFTERELCSLARDILKKIFLFEEIYETVLKNSFDTFLKNLTLVYHVDVDE